MNHTSRQSLQGKVCNAAVSVTIHSTQQAVDGLCLASVLLTRGAERPLPGSTDWWSTGWVGSRLCENVRL